MLKNASSKEKIALGIATLAAGIGGVAIGEALKDDTEKDTGPTFTIAVSSEENPIDLAQRLGTNQEQFAETVKSISDQVGGAGDMQPGEPVTLPMSAADQRLFDENILVPLTEEEVARAEEWYNPSTIEGLENQDLNWYKFDLEAERKQG